MIICSQVKISGKKKLFRFSLKHMFLIDFAFYVLKKPSEFRVRVQQLKSGHVNTWIHIRFTIRVLHCRVLVINFQRYERGPLVNCTLFPLHVLKLDECRVQYTKAPSQMNFCTHITSWLIRPYYLLLRKTNFLTSLDNRERERERKLFRNTNSKNKELLLC